MNDFITDGLAWLQQMREQHCSAEIAVGLTLGSAASLLATVSQDSVSTTMNGLTLQKITFIFVVAREDLQARNIKLQRGLKIWYKDDEYELSYDGQDIYEYNDPNRNDVVLKAVLVKDKNPLHPNYSGTN